MYHYFLIYCTHPWVSNKKMFYLRYEFFSYLFSHSGEKSAKRRTKWLFSNFRNKKCYQIIYCCCCGVDLRPVHWGGYLKLLKLMTRMSKVSVVLSNILISLNEKASRDMLPRTTMVGGESFRRRKALTMIIHKREWFIAVVRGLVLNYIKNYTYKNPIIFNFSFSRRRNPPTVHRL